MYEGYIYSDYAFSMNNADQRKRPPQESCSKNWEKLPPTTLNNHEILLHFGGAAGSLTEEQQEFFG